MMRSVLLLSYFACLLLASVFTLRKPETSLTASTGKVLAEEKHSLFSMDSFTAEYNEISDNAGLPDEEPVNTNLFDNIIELPDAPSTDAFAPTALKDIPMADPSQGMSLINAPTANSSGNAVMNFDMRLPKGRLGMEPSLQVQYNNEGGSSWLGTGWNLSTPAISIETRWGVPRYDAAWETESYLLNGETIAPINNRSDFVARATDKRFYPRVESAYNKVIRHGSIPSNYWWEVTEKDGKRNFYGGRPGTGVMNNAVLKDDGNNIAYWALVETRDLDDNFIRYNYETVNDVGVEGGTVPGKQLYLTQVFYTGSGTTDGPYKVEFTRDRQLNETKRKDITIDGRLGFKMVSADLLRRVTISMNNAPVRTYEYTYQEGQFYKSLLKSISELDDAGNVFYSHNLEYYNDVTSPSGFTPSAGISSWSIPDDGIKGDLINPVYPFTSEGSALSTVSALSRSGGVAVTIGSLAGGVWSKRLTLGGNFNYGQDETEGLVAMVDINGDGLPDKVMKKGGSLTWRENLGVGTRSFGTVERPIAGVSDFSTTTSVNLGGGVQAIPGDGFFGYNHTTTFTNQDVYFTDFNGDGLMDIAAGGRAYFNRLVNGNPDFVLNSGFTPSPIFSGAIDPTFFAPDTALQAKLERDYPLQDIVRVWEAPFNGNVTINAPVQLINVPNTTGVVSTRKDGVRVSIQLDNTVHWSNIIEEDDFTVHTPNGVSNLPITKGQRIYFRMQSRYNGEDDQVTWNPEITYTAGSSIVTTSAYHHKSGDRYKISEDYIMHSRTPVGMGKIGTIAIDGSFEKIITSDSVWIQLVRTRNNLVTVLYERGYGNKELATGNWAVPGQIAVDTSDIIAFKLFSKSFIDRSAMEWHPHYAYTTIADGTPVTGTSGRPTIEGYPVPDNSNYNSWVHSFPPAPVAYQDTVKLFPKVVGGADGTLWFSIKGPDTVYARRHIHMLGGNMAPGVDTIQLIRKAGENLFYEFATDTMQFAMSLAIPVVEVYRDSIFMNGTTLDTISLNDTINANLYANPPFEYYGPLFRGWGAFALRGDRGDGSINQDSLNLDELNNLPTDPGQFTDSTAMGNIPDPSKTFFMALFPDGNLQQWNGYDTSVWVNRMLMSSSRLYVHDVYVDSLMGGASAGAVSKISTTETDSYSVGVTPGLSGSLGRSTAETTVNLDMMDMNGDRYPDVLSDTRIQYTLPHGGLGTTTIDQPVEATVSEGISMGVSLGGSFLEATSGNTTTKGAVGANKTARGSAGLTGNVNSNDDNAITSWIDINGDGLTDRIYESGVVSLNLGYKFAPGESWGAGGIDASHSFSAGAGLGVNIEQGSFEAGIGLSRTTASNNIMLNDINGDGLPDELTMSGSNVMVRLNKGNGFGPTLAWNNFNQINTNISTGESINGSFTIPIIIPIPFFPLKIDINPNANFGHGVSKQEEGIMDIDGDGYADMLHSSFDGELTASASTIARTNMLKMIKGPLGGYFSMDYERVGNTYDMPQSKWVLKSVEIYDGVPGDGIDTVRSVFNYEGGVQDRHEREFYGFRKVTTRELNTPNNTVYRSHVQQFLNTNYYNKGLLVNDWMEDGQGRKYSQTNYLYEFRELQDSAKFPYLKQVYRQFFEGAATAGATTTINYEYDAVGNTSKITDMGDGNQQDVSITNITYHDLDAIYVKNVPAIVEVTSVEGVKRRTVVTVNSRGSITRVRQVLADNTFADMDLEYDNYGNLSKMTRPANYKGERMLYEYEYDGVVHSYVTKITDAYGYSSSSTYDYRFGELLTTLSMNDEPMRYTLDNRGRVITITGPYELAAGKPYSISYGYNTTATIPFAVTRRYDPEHNADIRTINFVDGLGRSIQVKKQASIFKGKNVADDLVMVISGTDLFDAFGRISTSYYPITEPIQLAQLFVLNPGTGNPRSSTTYDVQDRILENTLADGTKSTKAYSIINGQLNTSITDALNNKTDILLDVRGRKRALKEYGPAGIITTRYDYNALNELIKVTDNKGSICSVSYDNMGRKTSLTHPDGGTIEFEYDAAGNMTKKITAQLRKEIANGGAIQYRYEYERMTDIDYPRHYQNKVKYVYGKAGTGNKAGRLILQEDATGGQEFFYGRQGEIVKTIRTVLVNPVFATTYVSEQEFDTWGRVKKIAYPDGEIVNYHYNKSGGLLNIEGSKGGNNYKYVNQAGYDEFEQRIYLLYGNGAEIQYKYDNLRRRLVELKSSNGAGQPVINNAYTYDAINNVTGIINNVPSASEGPGGYVKQDYHYDNLYRLDSASGEYKGASATTNYGVKVEYDNLNNIVHKTMKDEKGQRYDQVYAYGTAPHQAITIGKNNYKYDLNGNQLGYGDIENFFDEENRLIGVINKGDLSQYTYDAGGIRVIKSSGGLQGIWVNGAPAGAVRHRDNYSIDVNPFITCRQTDFTKHYYIDNQRIASKQGHGSFTNISFPQSGLTAGGIDYTKRAAAIEKARIEYYASLGVSPGPPTDKNFWARPENSGIPAPVFTDTMSFSVPIGWPGNTTPPTIGPPIFVDSIPSNDSVRAGYGFHDPGHFPETSQAFYHPDHLGSSWYVTNVLGKTSQHFEYTPFGETFIEENTSSYKIPYLFNGEGRDETGYYQYADRYYDPALNQWLSIDPDDDPAALTDGYMANGNQNLQGGHFGFSLGSAEISETVFGDASAGLQLDALGENAGGRGKGKSGSSNKEGPKIGKNKSAAGNKAGRGQNGNIGQRRNGANRQGRNAFGNNNMFYNHKLRQKKGNGNETKPTKMKIGTMSSRPVTTRPRR
jgi:RHS repeat-associated protein